MIESGAPKMVEGADEWRLKVLRGYMPGVGVALALVPLYFTFTTGAAVARSFWMVGATGLILFGVSRWLERASAPLALALALAVLGVTLERAAVLGWPPGVVASIVSLEVFVGLWLGRAAPYIMIVLVAGGLLAIGFATTRSPRVDFPPEVVLTHWSNWVRVGLVLVTITGAVGFGLYGIARWLERAEARLSTAVAGYNQQLARLSAARLRRQEREQALREAQKLQSVAQLGHGFAHAFNNALTVIRLTLEQARAGGPYADVRPLVAVVRAAVQNLAQRSRDLLTLARPAGEPEGSLFLAKTLSELEPRLRSRLRDNLELRVQVLRDARVGIPARWLEQLLLNLLLNSEQAQARGGSVTIGVHIESFANEHVGTYGVLAAGDYAVLRVYDDGPGMTNEVAARAFEPFFTTRGREHHDGLGLTLVYNMARQAGGAAEVEQHERGASIAVYLPIVEALPTVDEPPASPWSPPVSPWKAEALQGIARVGALSVGLAVTAGEIHARFVHSPARSHLLLGLPLLAIMAWVGWSKRAGFSLRFAVFLGGSLLAGLLLVAAAGYMQAAPVGLLCLLVLLSWILGSPPVGFAVTATILLGFVGIGYLHASGRIVVDARPYSLAHFDNWARIAINLSVMSLMSAEAVLHVLRAERQRVSALATTEAELRLARDREEHEAKAAADLEGMAQRAARIESLGRLTGMTAHDLNNSLLALGGWADLLASADTNQSEADRLLYLTEMERATDHAEALIARLEQGGGMPFVASALDVSAAIQRAQGMVRTLLKSQQSLRLELASDCGVLIDESCFRRVVLNLVANARDAMSNLGTCTIRTRRNGEHVEIEVVDDGAGMTEATQKRLFEAFFTTKGERGTGLGLHSAAAIIAAAKGHIDVHSVVGQGTRFTSVLPYAPLNGHAPSHEPNAETASKRGNVLLAEDEPTLRSLLTRSLERAGYAVELAADGDQAVARIHASSRLDVLCSDAVMPGASLNEVLRLFAAKFPGRPQLLMSGYLPADLDAALLARPEVVFLHKPFAGTRLVQLLSDLTGTAPATTPGARS